VTLADNGRAFDPRQKNGGRRLANMHGRASLIGAHLSWHEREGGGTVFRLQLNGNQTLQNRER